jgi:hypothetical protein
MLKNHLLKIEILKIELAQKSKRIKENLVIKKDIEKVLIEIRLKYKLI